MSIILFNDKIHAFKDVLVQASPTNKDLMHDFLKSVVSNGLTDFEDLIIKAYQILEDSNKSNVPELVFCNNIFFFITDGTPTTKKNSVNKLMQLVDQKDNAFKANKNLKNNSIWMTYLIGDLFEYEFL